MLRGQTTANGKSWVHSHNPHSIKRLSHMMVKWYPSLCHCFSFRKAFLTHFALKHNNQADIKFKDSRALLAL